MAEVPPEFLTALADLRRASCRPELYLHEVPAPSRLAPYSVAMGADITEQGSSPADDAHGTTAYGLAHSDGDTLATGRFILLHSPEGSSLWEGTFRIVTYIRARLEPDMGNDALLGSVAWTWLLDALKDRGANHSLAGGTATRILSESFGSLEGRPDGIDVELRASWTPVRGRVTSHLEAWSDMVCTFAGLPPIPEGVASLPHLRRN
nr:DUF3000 domain-containing protein [Arthrobacter roseus]